MHNLLQTLIFLSLLILAQMGHTQTLQIGGKIGGTTVIPADPSLEIVQPGGTAGMFADYQLRRYRMGLRLEMNYQNRSALEGEQLTMPILAEIAVDKQGIVRLHAGPYLGINPEDQAILDEQKRLPVKWGFSTGLDLNIPLTRRLVLVAESRMSKELGGNGEAASAKSVHYVPAKSLRLSISFGLAYRIRQWRENRN